MSTAKKLIDKMLKSKLTEANVPAPKAIALVTEMRAEVRKLLVKAKALKSQIGPYEGHTDLTGSLSSADDACASLISEIKYDS